MDHRVVQRGSWSAGAVLFIQEFQSLLTGIVECAFGKYSRDLLNDAETLPGQFSGLFIGRIGRGVEI